MTDPKPVKFRGSALNDLRAFPAPARREAGHQLDQVQRGQEPDDWKPMPAIGQGVLEIRIRRASLLPEEDTEDQQDEFGIGREPLS